MKRWIHIFTGVLMILLAVCTVYAANYEKSHILHVKTAFPTWTEERQMFLPQGALYNEYGVWTVQDVDSIWGPQKLLLLEETAVEEQADKSLLVYGLKNGQKTQVVTECGGELRHGTKVEIEEE